MLENNKLNYKCKELKKKMAETSKRINQKVSPNMHQFCNGDINKFVLLLRKGVYPYEYIESWGRFDETSLPGKKTFYSELYLDDITNEDYTDAQKI